jgi:hypothetical protein
MPGGQAQHLPAHDSKASSVARNCPGLSHNQPVNHPTYGKNSLPAQIRRDSASGSRFKKNEKNGTAAVREQVKILTSSDLLEMSRCKSIPISPQKTPK